MTVRGDGQLVSTRSGYSSRREEPEKMDDKDLKGSTVKLMKKFACVFTKNRNIHS